MDKLVERETAPRASSLAATPALAVQFFLIPLVVVGIVGLGYAGFRLLLADQRTPEEYLNDIRIGGRERRWPAAYELSRLLADPDVEANHPMLGQALVRAFAESDGDDPRVRRYLALAVGRLQSPPPDAIGHLVAALDDPDGETRISVIWALAALGDASVAPKLTELYVSDDAGIRKMAVYALGSLPGEAQLDTLRTALADPAPDVQWNAAAALARRGDRQSVRSFAGCWIATTLKGWSLRVRRQTAISSERSWSAGWKRWPSSKKPRCVSAWWSSAVGIRACECGRRPWRRWNRWARRRNSNVSMDQ